MWGESVGGVVGWGGEGERRGEAGCTEGRSGAVGGWGEKRGVVGRRQYGVVAWGRRVEVAASRGKSQQCDGQRGIGGRESARRGSPYSVTQHATVHDKHPLSSGAVVAPQGEPVATHVLCLVGGSAARKQANPITARVSPSQHGHHTHHALAPAGNAPRGRRSCGCWTQRPARRSPR